jgi:DNA-binding CsgD family transcriptional regulator
VIYNPIQLNRNPVSERDHYENASAYMREALLLYFRGINPCTPDKPFRLPHDGSKCATAGAKRVRNDRMRSRHENTELNDREREFWRLIERGYTCEDIGERMGYANPRAALHTIKRKLAAQGELEL